MIPIVHSKVVQNLLFSHTVNRFSKGNKKIGIARAGNVIGGGDWSEDRLVPDCIKSWSRKKKGNSSKSEINSTVAACF